MFSTGITTVLLWIVSIFMFKSPLCQRSGIRDRARDRRSGCGERTRQKRPSALALPAFEITIAGRHAILPRLQLIAVHRQAHRTTGLAELAARRAKHFVQTFGDGLLAHLLRSRH